MSASSADEQLSGASWRAALGSCAVQWTGADDSGDRELELSTDTGAVEKFALDRATERAVRD